MQVRIAQNLNVVTEILLFWHKHISCTFLSTKLIRTSENTECCFLNLEAIGDGLTEFQTTDDYLEKQAASQGRLNIPPSNGRMVGGKAGMGLYKLCLATLGRVLAGTGVCHSLLGLFPPCQ